jgi:uncharacterized OB-fold protein
MNRTSENRPFTIESFYKFAGEGKLMAAKCNKCGAVHLPPRPACSKCTSKDLKWISVNPQGKLLTYTVIHVSPKEFESKAPYAIGIVRFENGGQLLGMVRDIEPTKLQIGMTVTLDFEETSTPATPAPTPAQWPSWPRYFFKPA